MSSTLEHQQPSHYVGRFAPSPTGPLHEGSVATALGSWLDARVHGGRWLVRIEDVDTPRTVPGADKAILSVLQALGLAWDGQIEYQSRRDAFYRSALDALANSGYTYGCGCSRKEIASLHLGLDVQHPSTLIYPGTCRHGIPDGKRPRATRFKVPDELVTWYDRRLGHHEEILTKTSGDFVLKRADGLWAYQLAVVVDDELQGVTHVVRGEDLADSTARQIALQEALGYRTPSYLHLPVVLAEDGYKLSKQNGACAVITEDPVAVLNKAAKHLGLYGCAAANLSDCLLQLLAQWRQIYP